MFVEAHLFIIIKRSLKLVCLYPKVIDWLNFINFQFSLLGTCSQFTDYKLFIKALPVIFIISSLSLSLLLSLYVFLSCYLSLSISLSLSLSISLSLSLYFFTLSFFVYLSLSLSFSVYILLSVIRCLL
jgi:hypothetical protein